ncbi:MAG: helix-turn-helix transcriptional regulator [Spirochaetales bacterium]|nr:helix-turn-helix transcriptional regulator [Spirochaetales bacterium]
MEPIKPPLIGQNIQRIRKEQGLTLDVLSEKSGVSKAMLSQIESEKVNPTVATVWKISQGLNVEINGLLAGGGEAGRSFRVTRRKEITALETDEAGLHMKVLSPVSLVEDLEMYLLTFEKGGSLDSAPHFPRTKEYVTVIDGTVRIRAGENTTELNAGDFATYHCDIEHSMENLSDGPATVHLVVRFNKRSRE